MIDVRSSSDRGRGVFATQHIPAGTELVRALPFALVPADDHLLSHCTVCLQPATNCCAICKAAVLCERCAASPGASKVHGDECAALKRLVNATPDQRPKQTRSLRLLIRCLCARWRCISKADDEQYVGADGSWWGDGDIAVDEWDDVDALVGPPEDDLDGEKSENSEDKADEADERHARGLEADDEEDGNDADEATDQLGGMRLEAALLEMAKQARYFLDTEMRVGHETAALLMGRLACNSLTMYGPSEACEELQEVGVAVSASVAMFNHDCEPSVDWILDEDGCIIVKTLRDVTRGTELCLSYVDVRLPAPVRRHRLRRCFFFDCSCRACEAGGARWSCALCGTLNEALAASCAGQRCDARQAQFAMPVRPRGNDGRRTRKRRRS